jgi:hypothetical protein
VNSATPEAEKTASGAAVAQGCCEEDDSQGLRSRPSAFGCAIARPGALLLAPLLGLGTSLPTLLTLLQLGLAALSALLLGGGTCLLLPGSLAGGLWVGLLGGLVRLVAGRAALLLLGGLLGSGSLLLASSALLPLLLLLLLLLLCLLLLAPPGDQEAEARRADELALDQAQVFLLVASYDVLLSDSNMAHDPTDPEHAYDYDDRSYVQYLVELGLAVHF